MNQLATQILDAAVDADRGDRSARLRARAAAQGVLVPTTGAAVSPVVRRRALDGMSGLGSVADELIDDDRERR